MQEKIKGKKNDKKGLGMGLSAIFDNKNKNLNASLESINKISEQEDDVNDFNNQEEFSDQLEYSPENNKLLSVDIRFIKPYSDQPRKNFDMNSLQELSESIKKNGVLQPILVRPASEEGYYEIIAGERRWRASLMAGLSEIPVIVKKYENEDDIFVVSVIENLQRSELLPVEELDAFIRLYEKGYTHEQIGSLVNKSRSYVTNILKLENLPLSVKEILNEKKITIGHAKALVYCKDPDELVQEIISKDLNVRQTEDLIRKNNRKELTNSNYKEKKISYENNENNFQQNFYKDAETIELEKLISSSISSDVSIEESFIKISYKDFCDLDRIINLLLKEKI